MNQFKKLFLSTFLITIIIPSKIHSQDLNVNEPSNEKLINAAREIIEAAGTCVLITLDNESIPRARIMDPFPPESDFTVWLGTNLNSRKVDQIENNSNVTLYYQDSDSSGYVVIHGSAIIVDDQIEKQNRFKEAWEAFYPNNREGYILIKVSPKWMEILSYSRGILGDSDTWQTPIVRFD